MLYPFSLFVNSGQWQGFFVSYVEICCLAAAAAFQITIQSIRVSSEAGLEAVAEPVSHSYSVDISIRWLCAFPTANLHL